MTRRAAITIDLDTPAADILAGGRAAAMRRRSYERAVPRLLELLDREGVKATFFAVGADAADPACAALLRRAAQAGHEVASHSLSHDRSLPVASFEDILRDILEAERLIGLAAGKKPRGFRAPGAVLSANLLDALARAGYLYDSSLNASMLYNAAKAAYGLFAGAALPSTFSFRAPAGPYLPMKGNPFRPGPARSGWPMEFPLTQAFGLGVPFLSYFLSELGPAGRASALLTIRRRAFVDLVLHDHEFLETDDLRGLEAPAGLTSPGNAEKLSKKIKFVKWVIGELKSSHAVATLENYATDIIGE